MVGSVGWVVGSDWVGSVEELGIVTVEELPGIDDEALSLDDDPEEPEVPDWELPPVPGLEGFGCRAIMTAAVDSMISKTQRIQIRRISIALTGRDDFAI